MTAALKNSNNSNGLFVVKLALLGNEDASATVEWMLNVLYPGNIPSDQTDSIVRQERDLEIMKDRPEYNAGVILHFSQRWIVPGWHIMRRTWRGPL